MSDTYLNLSLPVATAQLALGDVRGAVRTALPTVVSTLAKRPALALLDPVGTILRGGIFGRRRRNVKGVHESRINWAWKANLLRRENQQEATDILRSPNPVGLPWWVDFDILGSKKRIGERFIEYHTDPQGAIQRALARIRTPAGIETARIVYHL